MLHRLRLQLGRDRQQVVQHGLSGRVSSFMPLDDGGQPDLQLVQAAGQFARAAKAQHGHGAIGFQLDQPVRQPARPARTDARTHEHGKAHPAIGVDAEIGRRSSRPLPARRRRSGCRAQTNRRSGSAHRQDRRAGYRPAPSPPRPACPAPATAIPSGRSPPHWDRRAGSAGPRSSPYRSRIRCGFPHFSACLPNWPLIMAVIGVGARPAMPRGQFRQMRHIMAVGAVRRAASIH